CRMRLRSIAYLVARHGGPDMPTPIAAPPDEVPLARRVRLRPRHGLDLLARARRVVAQDPLAPRARHRVERPPVPPVFYPGILTEPFRNERVELRKRR